MIEILTLALQAVSQLAPAAGGLGTTGKIISILSEIIPIAVKEYQDVLPFVKNIITALKNDPKTNQDQLDQLDALNKQVDDAFDEAATKAQEEDRQS